MTRKHLVKKCTAGLLVSCLLCGSLPMTVMAQETTLDKVIGTVDSTLGTATQSIYTYVVNNGTAALDDIQNYVTANFLADYPEAQAAFVEQIAEWKTNLTTAADNYAAVARKIADEIVDELEAIEAKYGEKIDDIIEAVKEAVEYWMGEIENQTPNKDDDETIEYVSIGDSMSNGYCFDGYEQGNGDKIDFLGEDGKQNGVYGYAAYPNQFADWLADTYGLEVEHTQLALSAMRAEDLNYLLGGREDEPKDGWENQVNNYAEVDDAELSKFFQTEVAGADVITLAIGNASFGAYMLHKVTNALGVLGGTLDEDEKVNLSDALYDLDEDQKQVVMTIYDQLKAKFKEYVPAETADEFNLDVVTDLIAYTAAGFVVNYKGALEQIVELNPKADIILLGLLNTTYGMVVTDEEIADIPVGDIMNTVFEVLNTYVVGLPAAMQTAGMWSENDFYYAEQPEPKFIAQQFTALRDADWRVVDRLDGAIVRDRNIRAYNGSLRTEISKAFETILKGATLPEITLDDVVAFEAGNLNEKALSVAIYLGIEDAVAESCDTMKITLDGLVAITGDGITDVFSGLTLTSFDPVAIRNQLAEYLTKDDNLKGMCKIYAMFKIGDGMSVHPTPAGHDEIFEAVKDAYWYRYTAKDSIIDKVEELGALIAEYGPEALEKLYQYAEEEGYIDQLKEEALRIKGDVCDYINETVIPCLEGKKAALENQLDDLYKELVKLEEELKDAAEDVKEQIEAEIEKVKAMIEDVKAALEELNDAINDLVEYVNSVIEAVDNLIEALQNVNEDLMGYVDAVQDALTKLGEAIDYIEDVIADIIDAIDDAQEAFVKAVEDLIVLGEQVAEEIKAAAEEAAKIIAKLEEEAKKIPGLIEQAQKFAEEVIAEFKNTVETSLVKDTYLLKEDSYYVAIGDISLADENNYADLVAEELGLTEKYDVIDSVNFAEELEAVIANNAATIEKADLVTINLNHNAIVNKVVDAAVPGSTVAEADWAKFVGEEGAAEIAKAVAEINKYLAENAPETLAPILSAVIEQYAFATVSYAMYYAEAINAIHELAPDALVIVVGMYNALDDLAYEDIELGKFIDVLVKAMNVYSAVYAVITENTMYVDAPEVSFEGIASGDLMEYFYEFAGPYAVGQKFYTNAEGHEYIKEQILGQVEKEYQLGDVNGDGKVNSDDAVVILQVLVNLPVEVYIEAVADYNGDGINNSDDAVAILQSLVKND